MLALALALQAGKVPTDGKRVTEKGLGIIEVIAGNGRNTASIAKAIGVDRQTLVRICERQPEVAEALERGRAALSDVLHDLLMAQARKGSVTAMIWLDKARAGNNEAGPRDSTPKVAIQINLPAPKSVEDYMRAITATVKEVG